MRVTDFSIGSAIWPGLGKIVEEKDELGTVLGKLMAYPKGDHPDGSDLYADLHEELADVCAAVEFFVAANGLDEEFIARRAGQKIGRFHHWHEGGAEVMPVVSWSER